tara:strand:+ start:4081 stop:4413 length:333 start_codon:yes stop_codon:yes gene_type:complete
MADVTVPVWAPRFIELTKIEPTLFLTAGVPRVTTDGLVEGYGLLNRTPITIDINSIIFVCEYFDTQANVYRDARTISNGITPLVVAESYNYLKELMAGRTCATLCEYTAG